MSVQIYLPNSCGAESKWTCSVLFGDLLGVDFHIQEHSPERVMIAYQGCTVEVPWIFFARASSTWLGYNTLPTLPLASWDVGASGLTVPLVDEPLPVLFGKPELEITERTIRLGIDIFGTAFFMLSRYEESVLQDRDNHDRFPASASLAYRAGFLNRPILDEYVEVLWAVMHRLWPALTRKARRPRILVSCDLDSPYVCGNISAIGLIKRLGGDLLKRRSLRTAKHTLSISLHRQTGDFSRDPHLKAIDWIMDLSEKAGNRVAFYFMASRTNPTLDGCYNLAEPVIRDLMRRISVRGHEIGLHPSYNSYLDMSQTSREANFLRQAMEEEGIHQDIIGSRQHYLRWQTPETAQNLEAAGIGYDSTLSFADRPGFRCGTCHEYPMYDLKERRALKLRQRPLILMECSVIAQRYMGMGYSDAALELMKSYKQTCKRYGGNFTLLWHNSHLTTEHDKRFYLELIA
jgi:peptidoglycan/xylan/chitin deacetylase (PgdA/CDA1 family)